jgi:hypothetical protein
MRNLRVLFLTVSATFVLGVAAASATSVTSDSSPVRLTGSQVGESNVIQFPAGTAKCKSVTYTTSSLSTPATTVPVEPAFGECSIFGFPGIVHMNGCTFVFHVTLGFSATSDIVCPEGKEITATAVSAGTTKCTMHIPAQTGLSKTEGANIGVGATRELEITLAIQKIKGSATAGTGLGQCFSAGSTEGSLSGTVKFTGEKTTSTEHVGLLLD